VNVRSALGGGLALGGLGIGLWTAWVAASNHALARELDRRMRACDALEVWNESLGLEVLAAEEALLADQAAPPAQRKPEPEAEGRP
jgi:hypothetical protein